MTTMNKAFLYAFTLTALALSGASVQAASIMDSVPATPSAGEQAPAASGELDRIVAVVNNDIITEHELEQRVHTVAINLRYSNVSSLNVPFCSAPDKQASASTTRW